MELSSTKTITNKSIISVSKVCVNLFSLLFNSVIYDSTEYYFLLNAVSLEGKRLPQPKDTRNNRCVTSA